MRRLQRHRRDGGQEARWTRAGGTDGPTAGGWQDGSEMALGLFRGLFDGAELLTGGSLVNVCQLSAPESLLLGDDIYRHVCDLLRVEEVTDEPLAKYEPRPLPEDLRGELASIVAAVDSETAS